MFGGGLTVLGLMVGFGTYAYSRSRRPAVFPLPYRPGQPIRPIHGARQLQPAEVLVILPADPDTAEGVITAATRVAAGRSAAFLYRGEPPPQLHSGLLEITDPYLKDYPAQDAFARAESSTRKTIPDRRYIYVPGNLPRAAVGQVWRDVFPKETVIADGDQDVLPAVALDRCRRRDFEGITVLHAAAAPLPLAESQACSRRPTPRRSVGPHGAASVQVLSRPFRLGYDRNTPVGRPKHSLGWGRASLAQRRLSNPAWADQIRSEGLGDHRNCRTRSFS